MATIILKGVDSNLLDQLKRQAKKNRRSLNQEIIFHLESLVSERPLTFEEIMEVVEQSKPKMCGRLTEKEIDAAIKEGRE